MARGKSDYSVAWEEPPATNRGGSSGQLYAALEAIKERPNTWAKIVTSQSRSGASSILTGIKNQKRRIPKGKYDFTVRTDGENNTSALYAQFIGEE